MDNVKEWTSLPMPELLTMASCRKVWKRISAESSLMCPPPPHPHDPISQGSELNGTDALVTEKYSPDSLPEWLL